MRKGRERFRTAMTDIIAVALTAAIALTTLDTVFAGRVYLVTGLSGLALGMVIGLLANWRGWVPATALTVGLVLFVLAAGPIALRPTLISGYLPSLATLQGIWDGAVGGWRGLLTTLPPVPEEGPLLLVPFLCGFLAGLAGVLLAGRTRLIAAPVLMAGLMLVAGLLLGTREPVSILLHGIGFAAVSLVSIIVRQRRFVGSANSGRSKARQVVHSTLLLGIAAGLATLVATPAAVAGLADRFVLREHVELPFDPSVYPSPLSSFRRYEVNQKKEVLFSISGMPADARVRLATMDAYDGVVWTVAGAGGRHSASGVFERVGVTIPTEVTGREAKLRVTIRDLGGVWIPTAGALTGVGFPGQRKEELSGSFRYNRVTGTGVLKQPTRLRAGDTITLDAVVPPTIKPADVAGRAAGEVTLPGLTGVPDQVSVAAVEWTGGNGNPAQQLDTIVKRMKGGAFSDGTALSGNASWAGHSAGRLREFLGANQLVGDAEQYAATLALMARQLNLPARVVLGVAPPSTGWARGTAATEVTGEMVTAWVEVNFDGVGWVAFDPTPDTKNKPKPPEPPSYDEGTTQVIQPPVVAELPPLVQPPPGTGEEPPPPPRGPCTWCRYALTILKWVGLPLLTVAAVFGLILGLKTRRRARRRRRGTPKQRILAGWLELLDRLRDFGIPIPDGLTRREIVLLLHRLSDEQLGPAHKATVRGLASRADRAVFGPEEIIAQHTGYWSDVDGAVRSVSESRSFWRRLRARLNPITLLPAGLAPTPSGAPR